MTLDDYLSDAALIRHLCRLRLVEARRRSEYQPHHPFNGATTPYLPPRRQWNRFRPHRTTTDIASISLKSLIAATHRGLNDQHSDWAGRLRGLLAQIRHRVLESASFNFHAPVVRAVWKKGDEFRPLATFNLEDRLIDSAVTRYLRDRLDESLDRGAMAFRAQPPLGKEPASTAMAVEELLVKLNQHNGRNLFVAECDIKAFFDCVSHEVALEQFRRLVAKPRMLDNEPVDPRAIHVFEAYLACYCFQHDVVGRLMPVFQQQHPNSVIKWPAEELRLLHRDVAATRIGIPQGGAMSGLIANVVLDAADHRVRTALALSDDPAGEYLRYCDDMIVVTASRRSCRQAFNAYLGALKDLKLPYHPPKPVHFYDATYWEGKSRLPYQWSGRKWFNCVPWIQFVGYQMRYDGLLRIRKATIQKQAVKIVEKAENLIDEMVPNEELKHRNVAPIQPDTRFSKQSVLAGLRGRLVAMSVGRSLPHSSASGPLRHCWANGFRGLHQRPFVSGPLKLLDRIRQRQIARFGRKPIRYGTQTKPGTRSGDRRSKRQTSYVGQFENAGGRQLIENPYRAGRMERWFAEPVYSIAKWIARWNKPKRRQVVGRHFI